MTRRRLILLALLACSLAAPAAARADFGLVPGETTMTALKRDGTLATQAGSHPYSFGVHFALKTEPGGKTEGGALRDVVINAPPGLIGNPQAVPSCPRLSFEGALPSCLPSTQVGVVRAVVPGIGLAFGPLYNLTPPPGVAAQFGFTSFGLVILASASVRSEDGYGVSVISPGVSVEVSDVTATLWGTPADPSHTPERGPESKGATSEAPLLPFLTLPTSCGSPPELTVEVDSKLKPGVFLGGNELVTMLDPGGNPVALGGCEKVPFSPSIASTPTATSADSAAGLDFGLQLKNEGLLNPKDTAISETEPVKAEVSFPAGIAANPSAANGLAACSPEQFKSITAQTVTEGGCPQASKLGTLSAQTPLLAEPIEGSVYLAAPRANPFKSFLAIYIVAAAPERGVLVKQAGEVRADPVTGQLSATVDGLPPVPYSSFELRLREGPRAPLITPQLCGAYETTAKLYPFSAPADPVARSAPFTITSGAGGSGCASSESQLPAHPALEAGTLTPLAGAYSPFLFKVSRADGEQRLSALTATLPAGLTGKLAGVPYCSEAQIAAAKAREVEGGGAAELASPSCPSASQVGVVNVAAGAGPEPFHVQGRAYLAGPYKGAPLSLAILTPAVAGPFDLGAVVARAGLYVDEQSAEITVKSDPIPTILQGIPLDVRTISVIADREQFTLNPTSCEAKAITAEAITTTGQRAPLRNRFQVGGCQGLGFKPRLTLRLKGGTRRASNPKLIATLSSRPGDANIAALSVQLPRSAFLDQGHIRTICTRVQFAADACPPGSVYGKVSVRTPILDYPLSGNVYLRSSSHKLPDLVADLRGPAAQPIRIQLSGRTDSVKGALRNSFDRLPDAPFSTARLELFGGKRGLVVNSRNLCARQYRAKAKYLGQNGKEYEARPALQSDCGRRP